MKIPSLRSGYGLPARQIVCCDGRTSFVVQNEPAGLARLVHYGADGWRNLSKVFNAPDQPLQWQVDGAPHGFDWVEAFPFGYSNRTPGASSRCLVVQGGVQWKFEGARESVSLVVPSALFFEEHNFDGETPLEVGYWDFDASGEMTQWNARREEQWLFRDLSTFAGITGVKVASEPRTSTLHLCLAGASAMKVSFADEQWTFRWAAQSSHVVCALGLGASREEAENNARALVMEPELAWQKQTVRYQKLAATTPTLEFGRHTALRQFFRLAPAYLESMRVAEEPGAYRANNDYHWVWAWDMTRPGFGLLASNGGDFVREILNFQARTGTINEYDNSLTRDLRYTPFAGPGAQELMLIHDYLSWTGDDEAVDGWKSWVLSSARRIAENAEPTGFNVGDAASSDFPEEFGRTFRAWLCYSSSWDYGAYLGLEKLLLRWGEDDLAEQVRARASRMKRNFARVFWNSETGFWNEGVHPDDPDLKCDIPLSTALAGMDHVYGEDLYGDKLAISARFASDNFLREDGVHITARGEQRGWKEWTRQPNNWFAANDTMLARLMRLTGDARGLEKLFYLYEINFGYQPCGFEGKPFLRPLETSGSWQAFGAGAWQRNLVEAAAGLWADLGGLTLVPCGLGEPVKLTGLQFRGSEVNFEAVGRGAWPQSLTLNGREIVGTTKLPPFSEKTNWLRVEYGVAAPAAPLLLSAVDASVLGSDIVGETTRLELDGRGYTPLSFFAPTAPSLWLNGCELPCQWDEISGRGRATTLMRGQATLEIRPAMSQNLAPNTSRSEAGLNGHAQPVKASA